MAGVIGALFVPHMFILICFAGKSLIFHGRVFEGLKVIFGVPAMVGLNAGSWIVTLVVLPLLAVLCRRSIRAIWWVAPSGGVIAGSLATPAVHLAATFDLLPYFALARRPEDVIFFSVLGGLAGAVTGALFAALLTMALNSPLLRRGV